MAQISERAQWISGPDYDYGTDDIGYYDGHLSGGGRPNHVLYRSFTLSEVPPEATLAIASLGYRCVSINGRRVGDDELAGGWTNPTRLVYVDGYDVRDLLSVGANRMVIELGNGWYNPSPLMMFAKYNLRERLAEVGTPQAIATLWAGGDELLSTDESWWAQEGPVLFNNVYLGETHDLRWEPTHAERAIVRENHRTLEPSVMEPCRRFGSVAAVSVEAWEDGLLVDFGSCNTGFLELDFTAVAGDEVLVTYAETLLDGRPLFLSSAAGLVGLPVPKELVPSGKLPGGPGAPEEALQVDRIIAAEGENHFCNRFCYHSFRFAYMRGLAQDQVVRIRAIPVHAALPEAGSLSCGDAFYDELLAVAMRTKRNNIHASYEDCARERLGYGGDMVALAASNAYAFDSEGTWRKAARDFRNDQTAAGGVPETAPYMGIQTNGTGPGEGPLLWQLAYPLLVEQCLRVYGATDLVREEWPYVHKLASYLLSWDHAELASHCLGDHGSVATTDFAGGTPDKEFVGWCTIAWIARSCARLAMAAEGEPAARWYHEQFAGLVEEIRARFAHEDGSFGDGAQTSYAFAAKIGLASQQELADALARKIEEEGGVLTTGIFGTTIAYDLLHRTGHDDVVERWLRRDEAPSFKAMLALGNGTLTEQFHMEQDSYNHAMFSSYVQWLYGSLAGIGFAEDSIAGNRMVVRPFLSHETDRVEASLDTRSGRIAVCWQRRDSSVEVKVSVPEPMSVRVMLPGLPGAGMPIGAGTTRFVVDEAAGITTVMKD